MKNLSYFVIFILALITYPLYAGSPEKNASVEKMFAIIGVDAQFKGGFEAMMPVVDQQATALNLNANAKEELRNIYRSWFDNDINREVIKNGLIELYSNAFSESEINDLIEFYQTPTGQKFLKKSPELMKLGARIGMKEAQSKQHLLQQRLQPFFDVHKK